MTAKKEIKEVKSLIHKGKEKGFLTYEEVNDALPEDLVSPDQIDDVLSMFDEMDIEIVDDEADAKLLKKKDVSKTEIEQPEGETVTTARYKSIPTAEEAAVKSTDPVRLYLRKMGSVALLTREGEGEIAKRIEEGEDRVLMILVSSPLGLKELITMGERISKNKMSVAEVVKDFDDVAEDEEDGLDESEYRQKILKSMTKIRALAKELKRLKSRISNMRFREENRNRAESRYDEVCKNMLDVVKEMRLNKRTINHMILTMEDLVNHVDSNDRLIGHCRRKLGVNEDEIKLVLGRFKRSPYLKKKVCQELGLEEVEILQVVEDYKKSQEGIRDAEKRFGGSIKELMKSCKDIRRAEIFAEQAKNELVEANLRLVVSIAKKYTNR